MDIEKGRIAVIFVSRRTGTDAEGYERAAAEMEAAVVSAPSYLGHDSVSSADGGGITISYWRDEASVAAWRAHARHSEVRQAGRDHWYHHYRLVVASVMRSDEWHG